MRNIEFAEECYYHIYNRGVEKRKIFLDDFDRVRFLHSLYFFNDAKPISLRELNTKVSPLYKGETFVKENDERKQIIDIGAYCLMPNHFHLLIKTRKQDSISLFMRKLGTGYTMYFNKKYKRTGVLFEGVFKAKLIERDEYLKHMSVYIHTNPLELFNPEWKERGIINMQGAHAFMEHYKWSSYPHYIGTKNDAILDLNVFPQYFQSGEEYKDILNDWISHHEYRRNL